MRNKINIGLHAPRALKCNCCTAFRPEMPAHLKAAFILLSVILMKFRFKVLLTAPSLSTDGIRDILWLLICTRWVEVAYLPIEAPKRAIAIAITIANSSDADLSWNEVKLG